jgi:hypothetical protein
VTLVARRRTDEQPVRQGVLKLTRRKPFKLRCALVADATTRSARGRSDV